MQDLNYILNEGMTQNGRLKQALTNVNFAVDERDFDSLLVEVAEYAKSLSFIREEDLQQEEKPPSWQSLITSDEIVVLAQLKHFNIDDLEWQFRQRTDFKVKGGLLTHLDKRAYEAAEIVAKLGKTLLEWYDVISNIRSTQPHFPIFKEWERVLKPQISLIHSYRDWLANSSSKKPTRPFSTLKSLETHFENLVKAVLFLQSKYERFIELAKSHQSHTPQLGLLFAFVELLAVLKKKVNTFHDRHTDFYYKDVLKLQPKPARADQVILTFDLEEEVQKFQLSKGTPFIAGQDDEGLDLVYKTDKDLYINKAKIASIKGLLLQSDKNLVQTKVPPVMRILTTTHPVERSEEPWPAMDLLASDPARVRDARLGFAIRSPNLELHEGERLLHFEFSGLMAYYRLKPEISRAIQKGKELLWKKKGSGSKPTVQPGQETIRWILSHRVFNKMEEVTLRDFIKRAFVETNDPGDFAFSKDFVEMAFRIEGGRLARTRVDDDSGPFQPKLALRELLQLLEQESGLPNTDDPKTYLEPLIASKGKKVNHHRKFRRLFLNSFRIYYSTADELFALDPASVEFKRRANSYTLKVIVAISSTDPPLVANNEKGYELPTMEFHMNPEAPIYAYDLFRRLHPNNIKCQINVRDVRNLTLYNQIGQINPDGPFLPFGPLPNNYSYLLIGNREVFRKKFSALRLNVEWMDLPAAPGGFKWHYARYGHPVDNTSFQGAFSVLSSGKWLPKVDQRQKVALFRTEDGVIQEQRAFDLEVDRIDVQSAFHWDPEVISFGKLTKRGFLKWQLTGPAMSFGHELYPGLLSKIAAENAKKLTGLLSTLLKKQVEMDLPPAPYTPKIGKISMDYDLEFEMDFRPKVKTGKVPQNQFAHLHPFLGYHDEPTGARSVPLLPTFVYEGMLILGLSDFQPPGGVSLFFQMKEQDIGQNHYENHKVYWSFLQDNEWIPLKDHQIISDTTDGLLKSGIVSFSLPKIKTGSNTILESEYVWIRAAAMENINLLGKIIQVKTHAVEATFTASDSQTIKNFKIGPQEIVGPVEEIREIGKIDQPLKSFGGQEEESESMFRVRTSERLRHKNRCVNLYDYERIVLRELPEVNKVMCINAYNWQKNRPEAGRVLLVLVPRISTETTLNPVVPSNSIITLRKAQEIVNGRSGGFVSTDVINPVYEHVRIYAQVKMKSQVSAGWALDKLNLELREFVSPWLADPNQSPVFGRIIAQEEVQSFIQSRTYVDFVTKVSVVKVEKDLIKPSQRSFELEDTGLDLNTGNEVKGRYPWSVLTTASQHLLELIGADKFTSPDPAGLEELYLDEDFVITKE